MAKAARADAVIPGGAKEEMFLSITAPAFNEEENLYSQVVYWLTSIEKAGFRGEVVVANDGSTDATGSILDALRREHPNVVAVHHPRNMGYGKALASALQAGRGTLVLTLDSDGQFDAAEAQRLLDKLAEGYDLVSGYRVRKRDSLVRVLADRALRLTIRLMFGLRLRDPNCAMKLYKGEKVRSLQIEASGYPTPTELVIKAHALGWKIGEVPITHRARQGGRSKLRLFRTAWNTFLFLLYLRFKLFLFRRGVVNSP